MKKSATGEKTSLLKWAEERMKLKRELEEEKKKQQTSKEPQDSSLVAVPCLPEDCIFHIIVRLPLESLLSSRFVCKAWYRIVNRPDFVNSHLQRSSTGLIYLTPAVKVASCSNVGSSSAMEKNEFNVDANVLGLDSVAVLHWHLFSPRTRFQIKYLEIRGSKSTIKEYNVTCTGHIKAMCNGLIVLEKVVRGRGLIVMNPVTREVETVPLGTMCVPHRESYGLAFCHESSRYKLVHLFQDASQCIGCEIMHFGSGPWRVVEGPPHGFMGWLGYPPVSAIGALHWVPNVDHNEHILSMPLRDEEFIKIPLPNTGGIHDRVLEIGGSLGFVSRESAIRIDVWILKSLGGEGWAKQHSIVLDCARDMVPLYCMGPGGELVFEHGEHLYAYDRRSQLMRKVEAKNEWRTSPGCYFPHVNSLISWRI
ncbi:putative F-box protein [Salvia divinorum]|uniref:F-box protein n=1 Tax=Salvia divinorum TaxID=28513 RepID=A0ABD1FPR5_SALDI